MQILDLSEKGTRVSLPKGAISQKLKRLILKTENGPDFSGDIRWMNKNKDGDLEIGIEFLELNSEQYRFVIKEIYSNPESGIGEKDYKKAGLFPTAFNFMRQTKREPLSQRRMLIREKVHSNGLLEYNQLNYSMTIVDLSSEGAQIKTKARVNKGDQVILDISTEKIEQQLGEVRWVKRKGRNNYIGIQFSQENH